MAKRRRGRFRVAAKEDRTSDDGITFDSKKEMTRYYVLRSQQQNGEIFDLRLQPEIVLHNVNGDKICSYFGDFWYEDVDGVKTLEDVKGYRTDVYMLKRKMVLLEYGIEIYET